jgi:hypothetical protein
MMGGKMKLDKAVVKIVDYIAKTGKPYREAVDHLWDKIPLDVDDMREVLRHGVQDSAIAGNHCVKSVLNNRIRKYKKSPIRWKSHPSRGIFIYEDVKTCTSEEAQRLILTLKKASWATRWNTKNEPIQVEISEPKAKQILWKGFTDEQMLRVCTTAEKAGIQCYVETYNRHLFIFAPIEFYLQHVNLPVQEMNSNNFKRYESLVKRRMLRKVNAKLGR